MQTPMSILVNSTISDEGMADILEQQSTERAKLLVDKIGVPAKTSHATKRRKDEANLYGRRGNHSRGLS